jgi:hypothetical protein
MDLALDPVGRHARGRADVGMMNVDVGKALHASSGQRQREDFQFVARDDPDAFCKNSSSTPEPKHGLLASYDDHSSNITAAGLRS